MQVKSAEQSEKQARQAIELARESLEDVRRQVSEATIYAPFDGVVAMVLAEEGDLVPSPSYAPQTIVQITDTGALELLIDVDEIDIPLVKAGQAATVNVEALQNQNITGFVNAVYPVPVEVGGIVYFKVRITLESPENAAIKVGMSASADIVAEQHTGVIIVPSRAIGKDAQGKTVVKVDTNGDIQEREIVVGLDDGLRAEIISGLNEGETVVVETKTKPAYGMSLF
jgi:HlyD family secretion protein